MGTSREAAELDGMDDLEPLTLRQKVANKRLNKRIDNIVAPFKAAGLGIVGYGAIKPAIDAANGETFPLVAFVLSLIGGVVVTSAAIYVQNRTIKRED